MCEHIEGVEAANASLPKEVTEKEGSGQNKREPHCKRKLPLACALAYVTLIATRTNTYALADSDSLLTTLSGTTVSQWMLFLGLCSLFMHALRRFHHDPLSRTQWFWAAVPAAVLALIMVVGSALEYSGTLASLYLDRTRMAKALLSWCGFFSAFTTAIACLYSFLPSLRLCRAAESVQVSHGLWGKYLRFLRNYPFRTTFFTLLLLYLPYTVMSYPGLLMGDVPDMVLQGYNLKAGDIIGSTDYLNYIDPSVRLNGHHPIAYTLWIHLCLQIGNFLFHSYNVGLFIVSLSQLLAVSASVAAAVRIMMEIQLREQYAIGLILYFALAPRMQNYMFVLTKDVPASAALLCFILSVFSIIRSEKKTESYAFCVFSGIMLLLLRNEGKYIIIGTLLLMLVALKGKRRSLAISAAAVSCAAVLLFQILMPAFHITPSSRREMLSVPFQQTARYMRQYPTEVTEEERQAIAAVLDADTIALKYNIWLADAVKNTFRETATDAELADYFRAWLQMGKKHPTVYLDATLNNYLYYFYPSANLAKYYGYGWSELIMQELNPIMQEAGYDFCLQYPAALAPLREACESGREGLFSLPVLSVLLCPAVYFWWILLLACYLISKKSGTTLFLLLPLLLSLGVCFLGPCNGLYYRYIHGICVSLPIVTILALWMDGEKAACEGRTIK